MNLSAGQIVIKKGFMDTPGEGEGGTNWNRRADVYALPRAKELAGVNLLSNMGSSAQGSEATYRWGMTEDERQAQEGRDMCTHSWSTLLDSRNQHTIEK